MTHVGARVPGWRAAARTATFAMLLVAAGAVAGQAAAQTLTPATVTVSDFGPVTLTGTPTSTTATMSDFSVTDAAGLGWQLTVQTTLFAEVDADGAYVPGGRTLPAGSLSMPAPTVTPVSDFVTVAPGPHALDGATVEILRATAEATGTFDITSGGPLTLSLPASTYAGSYRSEITVAVVTGP